MEIHSDIFRILAHYSDLPAVLAVERLGNAGGFSGACFWRVVTAAGDLCLRRWPQEHLSEERLKAIHNVLQAAEGEVSGLLPLPWRTSRGATYVETGATLWELTPWMPGQADFRQHPSTQRLSAAMAMLARFHRGAATACFAGRNTTDVSPGIRARLVRLRELEARLPQLQEALETKQWAELTPIGRRILSLFVAARPKVEDSLAFACSLKTPLQPCIRDIWHDHVLFTGDQVTGLVDFGAMNTDCVAADISRLLGSLIGDDPAGWQSGLDAYRQIRPLSRNETQLVSVFDASSVLMSGMNWLDWICLQGRHFPDRHRVLARVMENRIRLEQLIS